LVGWSPQTAVARRVLRLGRRELAANLFNVLLYSKAARRLPFLQRCGPPPEADPGPATRFLALSLGLRDVVDLSQQ